jgi:adenylate kinase
MFPDASDGVGMKLVVFGPPSAGKGTQAQKLSTKYGLPQVSTGDLLRKAVADRTPLGLKVKSYLDQGRLGPDDLIVKLIKERVSKPDCKNGYLLDGFPRTIGQAKELDRMTDVDLVLNIVVDMEVLVERAVGRRSCPKCGAVYHIKFNPPMNAGLCEKCGSSLVQRNDDKEETVRNRLKVYREQTAPLIDHYRKKGKLVDIDGSSGIDAVFSQMVKAVSKVKD